MQTFQAVQQFDKLSYGAAGLSTQMRMLEVQRIRAERDGPYGAGVFFRRHAGRASKLSLGEFRGSHHLDWFHHLAENGL